MKIICVRFTLEKRAVATGPVDRFNTNRSHWASRSIMGRWHQLVEGKCRVPVCVLF